MPLQHYTDTTWELSAGGVFPAIDVRLPTLAARLPFGDRLRRATLGLFISSGLDDIDLHRGGQSVATASQLGNYFQYVIDNQVSLARQKSAMLTSP